MDTTKNTHYTNKYGKQLKDYIKENDPEFWAMICNWSAIKYFIRAGKKEGESEEKDLGKCEDYVEEFLDLRTDLDDDMVYDDLRAIKEAFENWKG